MAVFYLLIIMNMLNVLVECECFLYIIACLYFCGCFIFHAFYYDVHGAILLEQLAVGCCILSIGLRNGDMIDWYQSSRLQLWASMGHEEKLIKAGNPPLSSAKKR